MRPVLRILLALTAFAAWSAPAAAAPTVDGVFDLPGVQTNGQLVQGPDGNIWVSLEGAVGRVQPDGTVTTFASAQLGNALGTTAGGITSAAGFIWVSQTPGGGKEAIVKIPPANPAGATGVAGTGITAGAVGLTAGPDGNIWVAVADKIVKFAPSNPAGATTYNVPGLLPRGIAFGSDGTLWVTDTANGGRLLNVTTGGLATPYPTGGQPQFVGAGPNGQVAFGNPNSTPQQIGLLSPGAAPQTIDRPNGSDPFGVTFGADGAYWIAEFAGNRLARVTTDGQLTTLEGFPAVTGQGPRQITAGPGNTLWATLDKPGDPAATKIARITGVDPPATNPGTTPGDGTPTGDQTPTGNTPPPDKTPPIISNVSLSKTRTAVILRLTLSEAATLKAKLSRAVAGKRRGKACVRPTPRLRSAKRCTRFVRVRTVSAAGVAGQNAMRVSIRKLPPGRYRLVLTAVDAAGNVAAPVTRRFIKR